MRKLVEIAKGKNAQTSKQVPERPFLQRCQLHCKTACGKEKRAKLRNVCMLHRSEESMII